MLKTFTMNLETNPKKNIENWYAIESFTHCPTEDRYSRIEMTKTSQQMNRQTVAVHQQQNEDIYSVCANENHHITSLTSLTDDEHVCRLRCVFDVLILNETYNVTSSWLGLGLGLGVCFQSVFKVCVCMCESDAARQFHFKQ